MVSSLFMATNGDSNNSMHQSGGLVLARAGPSETSIFAKGKNANESHHPPHKNPECDSVRDFSLLPFHSSLLTKSAFGIFEVKSNSE